MSTETKSRLEELRTKYKPVSAATTYRSFEGRKGVALEERAGSAPSALGKQDVASWHGDMAAIKVDLASLAEQYGALNVNFSKVLGKGAIYNFRDLVRIAYNKVVRDPRTVRQVKINAAIRSGTALEQLVDDMAGVLEKQYQLAVTGVERAKTLKEDVVGHIKTLDKKMIENLRSGKYRFADYATAQVEVTKLETELKEVEDMLGLYESDIKSAQVSGDIDKVTKLTDEVSELLNIKHGILDGRLSADGVVSDIRREILDSTEAVQSAKGAIAASKVNYLASNALVDSYKELEIKYRHAKEDFIPVFKHQARIGVLGEEASKIRDALLRASEISAKLMETNAALVEDVAKQTFELLQTPLIDPVKSAEVESRLKESMAALNKSKIEWAKNQTDLSKITESAYAQQA